MLSETLIYLIAYLIYWWPCVVLVKKFHVRNSEIIKNIYYRHILTPIIFTYTVYLQNICQFFIIICTLISHAKKHSCIVIDIQNWSSNNI